MAHAKLTPEVRDILERSTIEGTTLKLPPEQLERKQYEAVNKALVNAGGKWTKGKGHVFSGDPREKLGLMLETGVSVDTKKVRQAFYTPESTAAWMVSIASVHHCTVLEPSAGEGALVKAILNAGARHVKAIEIDHETVGKLGAAFPSIDIYKGDFLNVEPLMQQFDRVVMNPPFTKNQDIAHVQHALKFVRPGGRLVSIMADSQERPKFQELLKGLDYEIEELPAGTFKSSGTGVKTIILTVDVH